MPKIFVSYRREDSEDITHRIGDRLVQKFGRESVFIDIDSMSAGLDFPSQLQDALAQCDVLLAVIGSNWLDAMQHRLDDPHDFVRIEIESALKRNIVVIPVLVRKAAMPAPDQLPSSVANLARRQAVEVQSAQDFEHHVRRLIQGIEERLVREEEKRREVEEAEEKRRRQEEEKRRRREEEVLRRREAEERRREEETLNPQRGVAGQTVGRVPLRSNSWRTPSASRVILPLHDVVTGMDGWFDWMAAPFGIHHQTAVSRYVTLFCVYFWIYLSTLLPIPYVPLVALALGYLGVVAIGRAWVLNEKRREYILKEFGKYATGDNLLIELPDLRGLALISALQLPILFMFIFQQAQLHFGLYVVPEGATPLDWMVFPIYSGTNAAFDWLHAHGLNVHHINCGTTWGSYLLALCWVTIGGVLIQDVRTLFGIRATIREAISALPDDPAVTARLGRRAIKPLIAILESTDAGLHFNAAKALSEIREPAAIPALIEALKHMQWTVRREAAVALGEIGDARAIDPLIFALKNPKEGPRVRSAVVVALGKLGDKRAIKPLLEIYRTPGVNPSIRAKARLALQALGEDLGEEDNPPADLLPY